MQNSDNRRAEIRDAAFAVRDKAQRQGCLTLGLIAVVLVWLLDDCSGSDAPQGAEQAAPVQQTAPPADKAVDLAGWITVLTARLQSCERTSTAMGQAMTGQFDAYRIYALADEAEAACDADEDWVKQVAPPTWLNAAAAASAGQAADACSLAAFTRKTMARKIKVLADSGMRPSAMREAQLASEQIEAAVRRCAALPIKAALDEGVDAKALSAALEQVAREEG